MTEQLTRSALIQTIIVAIFTEMTCSFTMRAANYACSCYAVTPTIHLIIFWIVVVCCSYYAALDSETFKRKQFYKVREQQEKLRASMQEVADLTEANKEIREEYVLRKRKWKAITALLTHPPAFPDSRTTG